MNDRSLYLDQHQYHALKIFKGTTDQAIITADTAQRQMTIPLWNFLRRTVLIRRANDREGWQSFDAYCITGKGEAALALNANQWDATEGPKEAEKSTGEAHSVVVEAGPGVSSSGTEETRQRANTADLMFRARLKAARSSIDRDIARTRTKLAAIDKHPDGFVLRDSQLAAVAANNVLIAISNALGAAINATPPKEPEE
jgi:hypothetical protein